MKKGTVELSYEVLIIIAIAILVAIVIIAVAIKLYHSPATSSSFACDFLCSVKESAWLLKFFLPKIASCGC